MTQPTSDTEPTGDRRRVVIHASCACRGVANGFANVVVRKVNGRVEFDVHATGACVFTLDEDESCVLRGALTEWLG
jgi:hypothetical protein